MNITIVKKEDRSERQDEIKIEDESLIKKEVKSPIIKK